MSKNNSNVVIHIKLVANKNKDNYYFNMLL